MASGALPGFRDFYPEDLARRAHIFKAWRAVARRYGFEEYDGPPLEPLELYTKKSGEEIVGQLYEFTDKGDRRVALRPEMTPTFARMVGAKASALRKPVRWFSMPQLFRYERAQRGRLREHFQLNVDIVGEASEVADAELIAFAVEVMKELGLTEQDVRVRVSDRRVLNALLDSVQLTADRAAVVYAVFDKFDRTPREVSIEKLAAAGITGEAQQFLLSLLDPAAPWRTGAEGLVLPVTTEAMRAFARLLEHCAALGVANWIDVDFSIVRGLAYYTGTVFELFDAKGELRAICGGGRYDNLLKALGGADLPALGFGMGDVVLGELLTARELWPATLIKAPDFQLVAGNGATSKPYAEALELVMALRNCGFSVVHGLSEERYKTQATRNQVDAAKKAGVTAAVYFREDGVIEALSLTGKMKDADTHVIDMRTLQSLHDDIQDDAVQKLKKWLKKQRKRAE